MNITVFGASGRTGRIVVDKAKARGDSITAFVRRISTAPADAEQVVVGDVARLEDVGRAVTGADAVICVLGSASPVLRDRQLVDGVSNIITAMRDQHVLRLIYLSFVGVSESRPQLGWFGRRIVAPVLLRNVVKDHEEKEARIRASRLAWTIVRPPRFTDEGEKGYRAGSELQADSAVPRISRDDVAAFMVNATSDEHWVRAAPSVYSR